MHKINIPVNENNGMELDEVRRRAANEVNESIYKGLLKLQKNESCFCGENNFLQLTRFDRYGLPFGTQICRSCGLISQPLSLTDQTLPIFYEKFYWQLINGRKKYPGYTTDIGLDDFGVFLIPIIKDRFAGNLKVLEIGCGQGDRLIKLKSLLENQFYLKIDCCDYSREAFEMANERGLCAKLGGVELYQDEGPYDVIILSHVLEHVVDISFFLEKIKKIGHDNTLIYIEVPGVLDLKNKVEYDYSYQNYSVLAHIYAFSLTTLSNVLCSKGYKLIKGTEFVRAIFSRNSSEEFLVTEDPFKQIMLGLQDANTAHQKFLENRNKPIKVYLRNIFKALAGRLVG